MLEYFWDYGFLLGIDADVLYDSLEVISVRLVLEYYELVYWF